MSDDAIGDDALLTRYFDALLAPARARGADMPAAPVVPDVEAERASVTARRYRCCQVGSLRLALPLAAVAAVRPRPVLTPAPPTAPSWHLGTLVESARRLHVVSLAALTGATPGPGRTGVLVVLDAGHWALACSDAETVIELRHDEVRWRARGGTRPWLAGTALAHGCAVLDILGLTGLLASELEAMADKTGMGTSA